MPTANGRTVFLLGRRLDGNRQAMVVEDGQEYSVDPDTITVYTSQTVRFPYEI